MIVSFLMRSGIVVGTVYYMKKAGIWGSPEESEELYGNIKDGLRPHVHRLEKHLPFEVPAMPQRDELSFLTQHYYNQGVKSTFHFIEMVPCYTGQIMKKIKNSFDEFSQPPKAAQ